MARLRDEITKTIHRLGRRSTLSSIKQEDNHPELDETRVATDTREGRQYGNYRVLRRLGTGGMGQVYLAIDIRLGRHAALKFLSPKLKSNPEMLARLQQEARTASSLNHPNILTIYDIDEAAGEPFIASEYVEGVTLRQALENGSVGPPSALDIAIQIASALKPAHEAGVVHRDLKPGNVMIRPDGLIKVIDFGLAKLAAQGEQEIVSEPLSDPGSIAGTVQYMSPEQARGEEVDHRTDVWSLGIMLYEMVGLRKPFDGETESHIIVAILDHRAPELKTGGSVPQGVARVVEKALAKSPEKRYQTADEMLTALRALNPISQSRAPRRYAARPKRRSTVYLVALVAACLMTAVWWWPLHGRETILGPDWFVPSSYTQVTQRGDVQMASLSPDGKHLAYLTAAGAQQQVHLLNLESQNEAALSESVWPSYAGDTMGITFSPDSSTIYLTVHDAHEWGRLFTASKQSDALTFVLDDIDGPITFSPDGKQFAFRRRSEEKRTNIEAIVVVKTDGLGDQQTILKKYDTQVGPRVVWSDDGTMAVNLQNSDLSGETKETVVLLSPNGSELSEYVDPNIRRLSGPVWMDKGSMLIFSGYGRESDGSQAGIVELSRRSGQFRFFASPNLKPNALSASADFSRLAALTYDRKSSLWVANADSLNAPQKWSSDDSFDEVAWNSASSIVHPSTRGGNISLWQTKGKNDSGPLPHRTGCISRDAAAVPGKQMMVFVSNCEANANASNVWLLNEADGNLTKLTEHSQADRHPVAAPDGDTVLYNSYANNSPALMKLSLSTKARSAFTALQARNAAISPDGLHVACQVRENYDGRWRVAILSIRDGSIEKDNLALPASERSFVRWSADGSALDFVSAQDAANIWRLPLDKETPHALTHLSGGRIDDFAWSANGAQLAWVTSDVRQDVIIFHRGKS